MTIKKFSVAVLLFVVSVCYGGASGSITGATKPTVDLGTFKTVAVTVKSVGDVKDEERSELKDDIVKCLQEDGKWIPAERGDLTINVTVTEMSRVSAAARLLSGVFAGKAKCKADISLIDAKGAVVSSFSVEGQSGGTGLSGGTGTAIRDVARLIAEYFKTAK